MQSGFILCILALASSADALDLIKAKLLLAQEPDSEVAQRGMATSSNMMADAAEAFQSSQAQLGTTQAGWDNLAQQLQVVPPVQVVTDAVQVVQSSQPQLSTPQVPAVLGALPAALAQLPYPYPAVSAAIVSAAQTAPASPASASLVAPVIPQPRNVTKLAFGQITDLGSEFHELREDDQAHVKQLGIDIHLREHLEQQLHDAEDRLQSDNGELAQETSGIVAATQISAVAPQSSTGDSAAALVQAQSMKAAADQIAIATERDVKTLTNDMNALHTRDVTEVKALRGNAETRSALSAQIAKENEELMADSGGLATNLGQIRDLVAPTVAPTAAVDSNAPVPPAVPLAEAVVQQEVPAAAAQESMTSAVADAAATSAVASPAPQAAAASAWLR